MDILNSTWLIKMLEKSSQKPHARLLSLFDILEDWLDAPNMLNPNVQTQVNSQISSKSDAHLLRDFLTLEAAKAGAAMPEMLASQIYFMAVAAVQERLQANNHKSLNHAKSAATALITAQTKKEFHIRKSSAYAIAAGFLVVFVAAGALFTLNLQTKTKQLALAQRPNQSNVKTLTSMPLSTLTASPEQTAALMAQLELMRHGNCQLIEAIQLPDSQKAIYINMVVNGQVSTDLQEQEIAMDLIKKTRCNYTPMLMANSTG